jgi:3-keto-5-aminohexanoate cleavage enzyme
MQALGVKPEFEVYSVAMLDEVAHLLSLEIFEPPHAVNLIFNTPTQGGQRGTPRNLFEIHAHLAELPVAPEELNVCVTALGDAHLSITTIAMAMGLDVRVGMEDTVFYGPGVLADSNEQLVSRAVRLARELGREPATPEQVRAALGTRRSMSLG